MSIRPDCPLEIEVTGMEKLQETYQNANGALICSAHLPLFEAIVYTLVTSGCSPASVVAAREMITPRGTAAIWGLELPAIVNNQAVLVRSRTIFKRGGAIAMLADFGFCDDYNPNIYRVARALGAQVIFTVAEILPSGKISVEFFAPPDPFCKTDESILLNLQVLKERVDRILRRPPSPDSTSLQAAPHRPEIRKAS